ncbi:hypothetical protein BASA50_002582 [Batrachochytrium salamandrivorans]|uniref:Uncharacterized protein n=1 Tax=Batrachochytrium salamandrivorans TaxID=1357716 RepID=A0ABQ8FKS1_9FUNG|nr:hypothetical protein BASA60_009272 [Batrachochytrium salamandrivorans]KAH6599993.1 hypothetical protein BASA50_002582 [Batrachochytrium salamandrivorans]
MSSLVVPIACWQTPPQAELTCVVATDDGQYVVSGSKCGTIIIYTFGSEESKFHQQLSPRSVSIGHSDSITVLQLCRIEIDAIAAQQNIVISGSRDGEIAMWSLDDGRCLQCNPTAMTVQPTSIQMSSSRKYLFCQGIGSVITILDASTLEVVKKFTIYPEQWVSAMSVYPTESKGIEQVLVVTFDGWLHQLMFNQDTMKITTDSNPQQLHTNTKNAAFDLQHNRFDKNVLGILHPKSCTVFRLNKSASKTLVQIQCPETRRSFSGFKFLSARSLAIWTTGGTAYLYYLGPSSDVSISPCSDVTSDAIVLASDGFFAIHVKQMEIGLNDYHGYTATCIGILKSGNDPDIHSMPVTVCIVPLNPSVAQSHMTLLRFQMQPHNTFHLSQTYFWASLFGFNVCDIHLPPPSLEKSVTAVANPSTLANIPLIFVPHSDHSFEDIWPVKHMSGTRATSATLILRKHVVLGHEDGSIVVAPASVPIFSHVYDHNVYHHDHRCYDLPRHNDESHANGDYIPHSHDVSDSLICILKGHRSAVTALFVPHFRTDGIRERLLSGSRDGIVKLWNVSSGELLGSFVCHSMPVISFTPMPVDAGPRYKAAVISVALDHSISVIDVDDGVCQYKFSGHQSAIEALYVRPLDDVFVVECVDGTLYVWQTKTGHLDRVVTGALAHEIISGCEIKAQCRQSLHPYMSANVRRTLLVYPVSASSEIVPTMLVYQVNIKRLLDDIANGEQVLTPVLPRKDDTISSPFSETATVDSAIYSQARAKGQALKRLFSRKKSTVFKENGPRDSKASVSSDVSPPDSPFLSRSLSGRPLSLVRGAIPDSVMTHAVLSALLSWDLDPVSDRLCTDKFDLYPPSSSTTVGFRGANGFLSFPVPSRMGLKASILNGWSMSGAASASRLITIMSLCKSVLSSTESEEEVGQILTQYGVTLPTLVGSSYCLPSLPFLAKYWQDTFSNVQESSRMIFQSTIESMSDSAKASTISYWQPYLPSVCKTMSKMNMRATLILGIMGSNQTSPLNSRVYKDLAESLDLSIREESKVTFRLIAIEIMGRAFATWEPHINGSSVLRCLINQTGLVATQSNPPPGSNGGQLAMSTTTSSPLPLSSRATGSPLTIGTSAIQGGGQQTSALTPALMLMARQAIVNIASVNAGLFISTLTFDLVHARHAAERGGGLRLLGMFITKKPTILYPYLTSIVDAMVKTLDPNTPHLREALQQIVTVNFAELVRTYPSVAFHASTQRLAVGGSADGFVIVHDLRTATKAYVLRGHTRPVHAVSFSADGKLVATFSIYESCVKIWQLHTGFLGAFVDAWSGASASIHGGSLGGNGGGGIGGAIDSSSRGVSASTAILGGGVGNGSTIGSGVSTIGVGNVKCFRSFNVGPTVEQVSVLNAIRDVKFVWMGDRAVKICSLSNFEFTFNV